MDSRQLSIYAALLTVGALLAIGFGLLYFPRHDEVKFQSTFDVNGTSPTPQRTPTPEALILQWDLYENNDYRFSLEYPKDWYKVDYAPFFQNNGTLIAFSPSPLPCQTCSYLKDGYISLKIYNQKTAPKDYADYKTRLEGVKQSKDYIAIQLNGRPGVLYGNLAAVEDNGWVYEFSLDKNKGTNTENPLNSKIFTHVLTSFKFTDLQFKM